MAKDSSNPIGHPFDSDTDPWPGVHVLSMAMDDPRAGLAALVAVLDKSCATLKGLSIKPAGTHFEAVLRIDGLACAAARDLATCLADCAELTTARVEHHLFTAPRSLPPPGAN